MLEPYRPRGNCSHLFRCNAPEVLLSGPAGTGKSVANLFKLNHLAIQHPGFHGLILRKTKRSLSTSGLVTFERDVLHPLHPARAGAHRASRTVYIYPNGSEIDVGGMDDPGKIMSTDYDCVYVQEAFELDEPDLDALVTRVGRRRMPGLDCYQIMMDTNPAGPLHWLLRRCKAGRCLMLETTHEDNPNLWDGHNWTEGAYNAKKTGYLDRLDQLPPVLYQRYRLGKWVQAEGIVYTGWNPAEHLIYPFPIPHEWPRLMAIDWGFNNPTVVQWWALDDDNRLYLYREIYRSEAIVEDIAREVKQLSSSEPPPGAIVCDTDREDRATFERHTGWETIPAQKGKDDRPAGLYAVMARLRKAGDGKPRLFVFRDCTVNKDAKLDQAKRPCSTAEEFDAYVWDTKNGKKDEPIKQNDHGCFAAGTMVETIFGPRAIETIESGELVVSHLGWCRVDKSQQTGVRNTVLVYFADGRMIQCTPEHPLALSSGGWVSAGDALGGEVDVWKSSLISHAQAGPARKFDGGASGGSGIQTTKQTAISGGMRDTERKGRCCISGFIKKFGVRPMGTFLMEWLSIIGTTIKQTMSWLTWRLLPGTLMESCTETIWLKPAKQPGHGTVAKPARSGIKSMGRRLGPIASPNNTDAQGVVSDLLLDMQAVSSSALSNAATMLVRTQASMMKAERVFAAGKDLFATVTSRRNAVRSGVLPLCVGRIEKGPMVPVFNLATSDGTYFANGVLVSNCDAMRYLVFSLDCQDQDQGNDQPLVLRA